MNISQFIIPIIVNSNPIERFADSILLSPLHHLMKASGVGNFQYYSVNLKDKTVNQINNYDYRRWEPRALKVIRIALAILFVVPATLLGIILKTISHSNSFTKERKKLLAEWLKTQTPEELEKKAKLLEIEREKLLKEEKEKNKVDLLARDKILKVIAPNADEAIKGVHKYLFPVLLEQTFRNYLVGKEIGISSRVCRNWHQIIDKDIVWNRFWKNNFNSRTNLGRELISWFPDSSLDSAQKSLEAYDNLYQKYINAFGGQKTLDTLYVSQKGDYSVLKYPELMPKTKLYIKIEKWNTCFVVFNNHPNYEYNRKILNGALPRSIEYLTPDDQIKGQQISDTLLGLLEEVENLQKIYNVSLKNRLLGNLVIFELKNPSENERPNVLRVLSKCPRKLE